MLPKKEDFMIVVTDEMIKDLATNTNTYKKGIEYLLQDRVKKFKFNNENLFASASVQGSKKYNVEIDFNYNGEVGDMYCSCPAFSQYEGCCKHIVAVLKECQQFLNNQKKTGPRTQSLNKNTYEHHLVDDLIDIYGYIHDLPQKQPVRLEISFEVFYDEWSSDQQPVTAISLKVGEDKLYVVKNIKKFFAALELEEDIIFGKRFTFSTIAHCFTPEDQLIIDILWELYEIDKKISASRWSYSAQTNIFKGNQIYLPHETVKRIFALLVGRNFKMKIKEKTFEKATVLEEDLPLQFTLKQENNDLLLQWENHNFVIPLVENGAYFFFDGNIYKLSSKQQKYFIPLHNTFINMPAGIYFSQEQKEKFVSEILPQAKEIGQIVIENSVKESFYESDFQAEVYLDRVGDAITAKLAFVYGTIRIDPFGQSTAIRNTDNKILVRNSQKEKDMINLFDKADFHVGKEQVYLENEEKIFDFVFHTLPQIQQQAEVFYSDAFRNMQIKDPASFTGGVRLNEKSDMLEFSFHIEDVNQEELQDIFASLREKKKYHRLKDGSFLPLDVPQLQEMETLLDGLNIMPEEVEKELIELPKYRALYMDRQLRESNLKYVERNLAFKQLVQNINEPADMEFAVPENLTGTLRDYQKVGFKWLKTLAAYGLGGILADDMGLGKTIQALAFILSEKEEMAHPALVVAPTSLIYNWLNEAEHFAPDLKVVVVSGTPSERQKQLATVQEVDLVVTSYALIRRDSQLYKSLSFSCCFLDEAQHIKNPRSLTAQAVKDIKAKGHFALTGTSVENNLTELWSIFDFVMPGYLLSHQKFVKKFESPIIKNHDEKALQEFQKQLRPFILRRMKKDVLKELPQKFETKMIAELTKEQKKVYLAYLQQAKREIEAEIAVRGFSQSQIKILAVLTRLRQICCHPGTFLEDYQGESGKMLLLKEIIAEAIKGGHRILLFSQFTSMLRIICNLLEQEKVTYFYLDGSIKAEKRGEMVRAFNQGEGDIFLISLKAGGTGLNLTGADMVIHYDPWWNPAVEEQATDRAYRIGQKNAVQVMKLITKGTIEEKINDLQQKKKAMIEAVIKPGETMISKLTEAEIKEIFEM